jgi:hypothetical protein
MGSMKRIRHPWSAYRACPRCGAASGKPCWRLNLAGEVVTTGRHNLRIHQGRKLIKIAPRRRRDPELEARRLKTWRAEALIGTPVASIAAQLGMTRAALDRYVCRARKRGHPDAIKHLTSYGAFTFMHPAARQCP